MSGPTCGPTCRWAAPLPSDLPRNSLCLKALSDFCDLSDELYVAEPTYPTITDDLHGAKPAFSTLTDNLD